MIAFNGGGGVVISGGPGSASILGNSIFANGGLGIDLSITTFPMDGVTLNDSSGHTGPNNFQNFPVLTSAAAGSNTTITGTLNSTPNTTFRVEFFAGDAADPTGFGEGQTFLGFTNVTTDANGDASFSVTLPAVAGAGPVTATATDPAGNTSEFSRFVIAASSGDVIIDANTPQSFLDSLTVIHGNLIMVNVAGRTDLLLPNLTRVDGDVIVTGNPDLTVLDAPQLASVGGNVDVSNNPALTTLNLGSLGSVGGDLSINNDTAATGINVGNLTTVTGNLSISGDTAATGIDVGNLTTVGGNLSIIGDTAASGVDVGNLSTVGGDLSITGDMAATGVDAGNLTTVTGNLSISGDTSATGVDVSSLTTVGGDLNVTGNTSMTA